MNVYNTLDNSIDQLCDVSQLDGVLVKIVEGKIAYPDVITDNAAFYGRECAKIGCLTPDGGSPTIAPLTKEVQIMIRRSI